MENTTVDIRYTYNHGKGRMELNFGVLIKMKKIRIIRKFRKLICSSDTPEAGEKIAEYCRRIMEGDIYCDETVRKFVSKYANELCVW